MTTTVTYDPEAEESARSGWYLANRDEFVFRLALDALGRNNGRVLDVGCGSGGLLSRFHQHGLDAVGVDRDWKSLVWGKSQGRSQSILQTDAGRLPFADRSFDLCVSSEMLEHIADDRAALMEMLRVTRRRVVFTVPAHMWLQTDSDRILLHRRRYSRTDIERLVREAGGRLLRLRAFGVLPMAGVLAYRIFARPSKDAGTLPLASRYQAPAWVDRILGSAFSAELALSRAGLIPVGHAWWALVERAS